MINIHNLYLDLVYSVYKYIKGLVPVEIHGLTTNLGSISHQLKEDTNYVLPWMIVNFEDIRMDINRPLIYQFPHWDISAQRTAFSSCEKDIDVVLQENSHVISLEIKVNCDSHLEALNLKHHLSNFFPMDKYIYLPEYTSFIEVPEYITNKKIVDFDKDRVSNIYIRHNDTTGKNNYYFGMVYDPLMKNTNVSLDVSENNETSYTITMNLDVKTNFPRFVIFPWINNYTSEDVYDSEEIIKNNQIFHTRNSKYDYSVFIKNKVTREIVNEFIEEDDINKTEHYYGIIKADLFKQGLNLGISFLYEDDPYICELFSENYLNGSIYGESISGQAYNIKYDDVKIEFYFEGNINGRYVEGIQNGFIEKKFYEKYFRNFFMKSDDWELINIFKLMNTNVIRNISDLNPHRAEIKQLTIKSINDAEYSESSDNGEFNNGLKIDYTTGFIVNLPDNIKTFKYDGVFSLFQSRGVGSINTINIQFHEIDRSIVTGGIDLEEDISDSYNMIFKDLKHVYNSEKRIYNLFVRSINITIDYADIKWIMSIPELNMKLSSTRNKEIKININKCGPNLICFEIPEMLFAKYFMKVNELTPLFLYIKKWQ